MDEHTGVGVEHIGMYIFYFLSAEFDPLPSLNSRGLVVSEHTGIVVSVYNMLFFVCLSSY